MKLSREKVQMVVAECLVEPHFPDDPMKEADYVLRRLERLGVVKTVQEQEPIVRRDIEAMPYDDVVVVEHIVLHEK